MHHVPRTPTAKQFAWLDSLTADVTTGKVFRNGFELGTPNKKSGRFYIQTTLEGRNVQFARYHIIWYKAKGTWPKLEIDHRDRNFQNDCIDNLKEATHIENMQNIEGFLGLPKGVTRIPRSNGFKYQASVWLRDKGKNKNLGTFNTPEEASQAVTNWRP